MEECALTDENASSRNAGAREPTPPSGGISSMRYCFALQVRPDRIEEYVEQHRAVWPEMLEALRDSGWRNYSLFLRDGGLVIGYVEADDLAAAQAAMAATDVNARWQAAMSEYFVGTDGRPPDESFELLTEIFHLEDQLSIQRAQTQSEEK